MSTALTRTQVVDGWTLGFTADEEPRIRDIDLAVRLGFERPRNIRQLILRHKRAGNISPFEVCCAVEQTGGRPATEYWLTQAEALFIAAQSQTAIAVAITNEMIRVFLAYQRGELESAARATLPPSSSDLRNNREYALECKRLLQVMGELTGLKFAAVHGSLRRSFLVASYRHIRTSDWPAVKAWLLDRIMNPVVPLSCVTRRQMTIDDYLKREH
jgi:hypothetical protein